MDKYLIVEEKYKIKLDDWLQKHAEFAAMIADGSITEYIYEIDYPWFEDMDINVLYALQSDRKYEVIGGEYLG